MPQITAIAEGSFSDFPCSYYCRYYSFAIAVVASKALIIAKLIAGDTYFTFITILVRLINVIVLIIAIADLNYS